jgi:tRNA pseudouridine38-40 synthase
MTNYKYKLTLSYDGSLYCGWQKQPNVITIQEVIQQSIEKITKSKSLIIASGRTDAGVHAKEQIAHLSIDKKLDISIFKRYLNSLLPKDIRILDVKLVHNDFHARYHAKGKVYRYYIHLGNTHCPFSRRYSYLIKHKLDLDLLNAAREIFLGKHDFSSFSNEANKGACANNPIKTIKRIDIIKKGNSLILEFEADGFLYKMVRNIVGALIKIASKKITLSKTEEILLAKDRKKAPSPAPAHGLFLEKVLYDNLSNEISSKDSK